MGLEPTTPCLQSRCSSQLSYSPERERPGYVTASTIGTVTPFAGEQPACGPGGLPPGCQDAAWSRRARAAILRS
jgi:hypothetical protein